MSPYVKFFAGRHNVLDLGCGRGEFLGLLRDSGIGALGVDNDPDAILSCRENGLDACQEDFFAYLDKHSGYDGIIVSHVIEHLNCADAERMVNGCFASLQGGGILLVVTPNPENFTAITKTFWLDPTHIRPYPLEYLDGLLKSAGFEITIGGDVPQSRPDGVKGALGRWLWSPLLRLGGLGQLSYHLFGGHDIYIVGRRP